VYKYPCRRLANIGDGCAEIKLAAAAFGGIFVGFTFRFQSYFYSIEQYQTYSAVFRQILMKTGECEVLFLWTTDIKACIVFHEPLRWYILA